MRKRVSNPQGVIILLSIEIYQINYYLEMKLKFNIIKHLN
jgi:hypothetical protein